jgi:hypothetical protein
MTVYDLLQQGYISTDAFADDSDAQTAAANTATARFAPSASLESFYLSGGFGGGPGSSMTVTLDASVDTNNDGIGDDSIYSASLTVTTSGDADNPTFSVNNVGFDGISSGNTTGENGELLFYCSKNGFAAGNVVVTMHVETSVLRSGGMSLDFSSGPTG